MMLQFGGEYGKEVEMRYKLWKKLNLQKKYGAYETKEMIIKFVRILVGGSK